jgi:hypothetical protein
VDAKALDGTPGVDAVVEGDGGACASGLPETGMVVRPMCTRSMVATGGTVPDGHYQLVAISALAACYPLELPPPQSSAFTVAGKNVVGVDGLIGDTGAITTWRHWRAQMNYVDNRINLAFLCGTSINPFFFAVVDDGVILFVDKNNSGHAYRFKRL